MTRYGSGTLQERKVARELCRRMVKLYKKGSESLSTYREDVD